MSGEKKPKNSENFKIEKEEELRFEVEHKMKCQIKLIKGKAEIFGTEIGLNHTYTISGTKLAIFTWEGAEINLSGDYKNAYTAGNTPMPSYIDLHSKIEQNRIRTGKGQKIMIAGNVDTGKSTLCKILVAWAARLGKNQPFLVDLDIGQNQISIPGTISCIQIEDHVDIEEGFSLSSPISFFFGHESPANNMKLYKLQIDKLSEYVSYKMDKEPGNSCFNTCGWIEKGGYDVLCHTAKSFSVDQIFVIDNDLLAAKLSKDFPKIKVEKIIKSGGVISRNKTFRKSTRMGKIREYFYGIEDNLSPHSLHLNFDEIEIGQVGTSSSKQTPSFLLPIGQKSSYDPTEVEPVIINEQLMHSILAVSQSNDLNDIANKPVYGYIYCTNVDMEKKTISVLSPSPGKLPSKILILGTLKWVDQS
eukprot:gene7734-12204_t